ncbi:MAG: endolytic transglycosylase MltG [Bacteroidota bacterium]|nr:endolytic transglycosylase MltG [Bacteroidota bacterium]MDP4234737.1 endolytic transglycosylase MltG [Bacteroidota bacterium]MDP4242629.1 endolytic transglycosylase MltG [Bacteroidota bacterium]MDP4286809.1 endolytic transglycosylase MltG [Bacteroidota bacterium]
MTRHYHRLRALSHKRFFWWITIPALVFITSIYGLFFLRNPVEYAEKETHPRETMLIVPPNATMKQIADSLKTQGIIRSEITFRAAAKLMRAGHGIHGGTFQIHRGLSNYQLLQDIIGQKYQIIFALSIPEGFRLKDVADAAAASLGVNTVDFIRAAGDTAYLHWLGLPAQAKTAEGYLYPDTYKWNYPLNGRTLLQSLVTHFHQAVPDTLLDNAAQLGLTPYDALKIASIVEGETKNDSERYLIAGVYENRFRIGMKLQADPTVQYGLQLDRPITHRDILKPTPYNTYLKTGLPPGPINNPSFDAIYAALHPAQTDYLFFVARRDGSRTHFFSATYDGQLQNIKKEEHNIASGVRER